jgi:RNA-directed DNA polymerase
MVYSIVLEEGFVPNFRKTRVMPRAVCQHVTGLVVNSHPNLDRAEFDRLKATLTNCARHGPASQNRAGVAQFRSHLLGRVAFCEQVNAARGKKLRCLFEAIDWQPC